MHADLFLMVYYKIIFLYAHYYLIIFYIIYINLILKIEYTQPYTYTHTHTQTHTYIHIPDSSVQFSRWVGFNSLRPHGLQHAGPPCTSPTPRVYPNSCPLWRRQWQPTPVLLPGKSHGWRSLVGYSPWDHEELNRTDWLHFHFLLSCIGEGNGNPLQYFFLENPRNRGAWWAAIYRVAQNRTWLTQLSSSSSMSIEPVMPSNHLILCRPLPVPPSVFPSIRVFSSKSVLPMRWPKYWSFSFSISPSNQYSGLISFRMDWLDLLAVQGTLKSLLQHHSSKASILCFLMVKGVLFSNCPRMLKGNVKWTFILYCGQFKRQWKEADTVHT